MLSRQGYWVAGSKPNDDIMLYAIRCAVPGLGGGKFTVAPTPPPPPPPPPPPEVPVAAVALAVLASFGAPTRRIVWDAVSMTIICWRACSSTVMARLPGSAAAAKAAPTLE